MLDRLARCGGLFAALLLLALPAAAQERLDLRAATEAGVVHHDYSFAHGHYRIECRHLDQSACWAPVEFDNVVATVGKNLALDTFLAGAGYTVTGPYLGLISSVSWSATAAADTMTSHAGWVEAGNAHAPTYSGSRPTASWAAASAGSKALNSSASFAMTGAGTIEGAFMAFGSGAVATIDNTGGTLLSAGAFTGGARAVINGDTILVSYSLGL